MPRIASGAAPAALKPGERAARAGGDGRQATLFGLSKVLVLEDVVELRAVLKHADSHEDDLVAALARLEKMPMSEKVLAQTRVGRAVNALCGHRSGRVRTMAKHLVRKWKELVLAPPAQRERPQPHEPVTDEERVRSSCRATLAARLTAACVSDADAASRVLAARSVGDMSVRDSASQARTDSAHSAHEVADSAPASATMQQEDQSTRASFDDPFFATAFSSDTAATTTTADSAGRLPSSQLLSIDTLIDEVAGAGEKAIWVAAGRRVGQSHGRVLRGVVSKMDADPTLAMRLLSGETTFENTIASEPQH